MRAVMVLVVAGLLFPSASAHAKPPKAPHPAPARAPEKTVKTAAPKKPIGQGAKKTAGQSVHDKAARTAEKTEDKAEDDAVARLGRGMRLFQSADYAAAQKELAPLAAAKLRNRDVLLHLLATSEALALPPRIEPAIEHFRALAAMQQSRYARVARARLADLLFAAGRLAEARAVYRDVLAAPVPEVEPAVARFRLAAIAEHEGDARAALEDYRRVFNEHPAHPLAARALARMRALDPGVAVGPSEHIARARRLTADHAWQEALDELALLPGDLSSALRDEAEFQVGMTHFKMRHGYDVAAEKLMAVWPRLPSDRQPDALFHGARAWSRAHQGGDANSNELDDRAIAGYKELVARFPHSKPAAEASFLIGWLDFNRGHYKDALPGLLAMLARYSSSQFTDDAHWFLGFSKWMMGDAAGALGSFEVLARRTGALDGGKGRYWKARALSKLGREAEAVDEWRRLAAEYPFTWYAMHARVRLRERKLLLDVWGRPIEVAAGVEKKAGTGEKRSATDEKKAGSGERKAVTGEKEAGTDDKKAETGRVIPAAPASESRGEAKKADEALARDADVARVDELLRAGLRVEAAEALDRVDGALLARYGAGRALPLILDRYEQAEDYFHVHRLAEAHSGAAVRRDPHDDPAARAWWQRVYPLAWRRFVEKYGPSGDNPTYYLYTIMQKESAYNPHDLSYADAIGLLQMIPPTSRRVGLRIGRPYTDDVLYDPEGNIQFGAWYIGHLLAKFKGQVALGAGSYNAGPKAMMRWLKQNGARPLDEFVELCPYTQTREYMKKALNIYSRYEWLYAKRDYLPDEHIDAAYLDNDIDY